MKQDKQENSDERYLVECNTNDLPFLKGFNKFHLPNTIIGGPIKGSTTDYEKMKMNRVIYL